MGKNQYKNPLKLICQWCDTQFTADRFRLFCGHECKVEYYASLGRHLWTEEEEALISGLIGQYPVATIVRMAKRKLKDIPASRIKIKVQELAREQDRYISSRVDNCTIAEWARILGVNDLRIHRWLTKGLKTRRSGKEHMITYGSMRRYASEHPSDFHGISRETLKKLFPKQSHDKYVEAILVAKPSKVPIRPVLCVTTNNTYGSLTAAQNDIGISRDKIKRAIVSGIPAMVGTQYLTFKWAD